VQVKAAVSIKWISPACYICRS